MNYTKYYKTNKDGSVSEFLGFTSRGCGTHTNYTQISKEKYEELNKLTYAELDALIKGNMSSSTIYGYGYYGHTFFVDAENDLYFIGHEIGNSCD